MFEWSEELQMVRDAVRQFVDNEIRPHREELEHGDLPPYDVLRKMYETFGMGAMALGIVSQCLELCVDYARNRVQFGQPIGEFQLIQLKLAKMEVARMNIQNLVFRQIELAAQATTDVCIEAVQLFGGNGYMAEYRVEQLCRDAKVLQIYGGTDEIQVSQIARNLMGTAG